MLGGASLQGHLAQEGVARMTIRFMDPPASRAAPLAAALLSLPVIVEAAGPSASPPAATPAPRASTPPKTPTESQAHKLQLRPRLRWRRQPGALTVTELTALLTAMRIHAGTSHGPVGIDDRLTMQDQDGFLASSSQLGLKYGTVAFETAGALALGNHTGPGHVLKSTSTGTRRFSPAGSSARAAATGLRNARSHRCARSCRTLSQPASRLTSTSE